MGVDGRRRARARSLDPSRAARAAPRRARRRFDVDVTVRFYLLFGAFGALFRRRARDERPTERPVVHAPLAARARATTTPRPRAPTRGRILPSRARARRGASLVVFARDDDDATATAMDRRRRRQTSVPVARVSSSADRRAASAHARAPRDRPERAVERAKT